VVLRGYRQLLPLHELLPHLPVELLQQGHKLGLRLSALRPRLQVHGGRKCDTQLVVEVEEEEQHEVLLVQESDILEPILHRGVRVSSTQGYCKYRNMFMMASYFLVFYLATVYDPNDIDVPPFSLRAEWTSSTPSV
jgi:hypothetical protein